MPIDPFAEPDDSEGTIIRPRPSGGGGQRPPTPTAAEPPAPRDNGPVRPIPKIGVNPLVAAASPVLSAAIRVASGRGNPPDPDRLRSSMVRAVRGFEQEALATGLDTRSLRAARYALCATVDDIVLSTPWGSSSSWVKQSLTSVFHNEVIGGERFFDILEQMQTDLGRHAPVVELMYLLTSLGFEGRYRVMPRGVAALTELRDGVYRTIRQFRGDWERDLSPHWRGIAAGMRSLASRIPLWLIGLVTALLAMAMYLWFTFLLAGMSQSAFDELGGLQPKAPLPIRHATVARPAASPGQPAAPPPPAATPQEPSRFVQRLHQFLEPEIKAGLVQVFETGPSVLVRLTNRNMFASGSAALGSSYKPLLDRIGEALQDEPGQVIVTGFTDNQQPGRNARFPTNQDLSVARAQAVADVLKAKLSDGNRLVIKGRGELDPIGDNKTADGRQANRRTEIQLVRPSNQQ